MTDFLIIGGGVIGMLTARELADAGASVTVIERGRCCQEASWAGGGIVSPLYPWRYSLPVTALASWAQGFYPELAAELRELTGIDPELQQTGLLMLDAGDESAALAWSREAGKAMQRIEPESIYQREPGLARGFATGLWMPEVANIRNPRLGKALTALLRGLPGVTIREGEEVVALRGNPRVNEVVLASGDVVSSDATIIAAGAWSGSLLHTHDVDLPIEPVKGQMLLYKTDQSLLSSIVLTQGRYLIPRRDNLLLVGSTLEYEGFDKSSTKAALESLKASAEGLLPALADIPVHAQWAGLRPGAPEGVPYIGAVPGFENLYLNAGHFRNGLVLAPASARLLADELLQRPPTLDPEPYRPGSRLRPAVC